MTFTCKPVEVSMSEAAENVVLTVRVQRDTRFIVRMWLMMQLLKLAAFVAPVQIEIEEPEA